MDEQNNSAPAKKMVQWDEGEDSDYDDEEEVEFGQEHKPKSRPAASKASTASAAQSVDNSTRDTPQL